MRRLVAPVENDQEHLDNLIQNQRLAAAPDLNAVRADILARYQEYVGAGGDPWVVLTDATFTPRRHSFHNVYESPPQSLEFIGRLRQQNTGACPMCGATGIGTLDHYLPKGEYPEFSFFSLNLIPACFKCNTKRNCAHIGAAAGQRPVHAYFDPIHGLRLMTSEIVGPFEVPRFRAVPCGGPPELADAIQWHITNIVEPAGFAGHCEQRWTQLVRDPVLVLGTTPTQVAVHQKLCDWAVHDAHMCNSPNSWDSCFYDGLSRSIAAENFLVAELQKCLP